MAVAKNPNSNVRGAKVRAVLKTKPSELVLDLKQQIDKPANRQVWNDKDKRAHKRNAERTKRALLARIAKDYFNRVVPRLREAERAAKMTPLKLAVPRDAHGWGTLRRAAFFARVEKRNQKDDDDELGSDEDAGDDELELSDALDEWADSTDDALTD